MEQRVFLQKIIYNGLVAITSYRLVKYDNTPPTKKTGERFTPTRFHINFILLTINDLQQVINQTSQITIVNITIFHRHQFSDFHQFSYDVL